MINASRYFKSLVGFALVFTLFHSVLAGVPVLARAPLAVGAVEASGSSAGERKPWTGPDGEVLPFENSEQVREFLRTADVTGIEDIAEGTGGAKRVSLEKDGIKMRAVFRLIESARSTGPGLKGKTRRNFRDNHIYEVAAYELSRMLGLDSVPPTVPRQIHLEIGSLQMWVENAITEGMRQKEKRNPPNPLAFSRQYQTVKIFDNLIYNEDRNLGNILIDQDWKLWMIDHTRTFRVDRSLSEPGEIMSCRRELWEKLRKLDDAAVTARLDPYLTGAELDALLVRKDRLIEYIQKMIDQRGEQIVLYD